jgi:hypothetical protein
MSAMVPPTFVMGAEEAVPAIYCRIEVSSKKNSRFTRLLTSRQTNMVPMFWAKALGNVKMK